MVDMKTLLISIQSNLNTLGLKYVQSYLLTNDIDSYILFIPKFDKKDIISIKTFLLNFKPKIIGLSLMSLEFYKAKKLTTIIKKDFPEIIIVWGGIHPTCDPKICLNYADYVFLGESEQSFVEFINAIKNNYSIKNIKNLAYKSANKIIINEIRPLNQDLDSMPFPDHYPKKSYILCNGRIIKLNTRLFKKYSRFSAKICNIITTRGCPFSCSYCCNSFFSRLYGKSIIRKRSVENVIDELKLIIKLYPNIIYIIIGDDCFLLQDIDWIKEFAKRYKKEIRKNFACGTNALNLTEEKITILKGAGLTWISMGIQTGSKRIKNNIYNRFVPNKKILQAARIINKYNLAGWYDIILDNPYETEDDLLQTIKLLLKIPKPYQLELLSLTFYPGTEIYNRALNDDIKFGSPLMKNFNKFKVSILNKIIRLCPLLPKPFIKFLLKYRISSINKILINSFYYSSVLLLEPINWFRLTFISFDYNIFKTLNATFSFLFDAIKKIFLREIV